MADLRDGRFVVLGSLGEGAQGKTFDGVDKREGRRVAIKRFERGAASWKDVDLAEREARVLQSLSHPKLPRYVDRFEDDGALYLVMEKIEGESLAALRKRGATLSEKEVLSCCATRPTSSTTCTGARRPSFTGISKPGNVLYRPDGRSRSSISAPCATSCDRREGPPSWGRSATWRPSSSRDARCPGPTCTRWRDGDAMLTGREPEQLPHRGLAIDVRAALRGQASDRMVEVLQQMLEPDPDRRASRIAPLLARLDSTGRPERVARQPPDPRSDRFARRQARRTQRRAERQARHDAAHAWAQAHQGAAHAWRRGRRGHRPPFPFSVLLTLMFLAATIAVSAATQVVVPLVLTVLSFLFARRGLTAAVRAVQDAGHRAVEAMDRAHQRAYTEAWSTRRAPASTTSRPGLARASRPPMPRSTRTSRREKPTERREDGKGDWPTSPLTEWCSSRPG